MNISCTSTCVLTTNVAGILQGMTSVSPITIYMHYHFNETMKTFYYLFLISQTEAPWHPCIFSHLISHVANKIPHQSLLLVKLKCTYHMKLRDFLQTNWFTSKLSPCLLVLSSLGMIYRNTPYLNYKILYPLAIHQFDDFKVLPSISILIFRGNL